MIKVELTEQHRWLERLVGDWAYEMETPGKPGEEPKKITGTETVRSMQNVWVVAEASGEPCGENGSPMQSIMTLGYNAAKGEFVGTWIGSMMAHLWVYRGQLDAGGKVLTLEAEGPDMEDPTKMQLYRDIIELVDDGHRLLRTEIRMEDGTWKEFMRVPYHRTTAGDTSVASASAGVA